MHFWDKHQISSPKRMYPKTSPPLAGGDKGEGEIISISPPPHAPCKVHGCPEPNMVQGLPSLVKEEGVLLFSSLTGDIGVMKD